MDNRVSKESLLQRVDALRYQARQARRLAGSLASEEDKEGLKSRAQELDAQAARLEKEAAEAKSGVFFESEAHPRTPKRD
jgi:hypothetical protein